MTMLTCSDHGDEVLLGDGGGGGVPPAGGAHHRHCGQGLRQLLGAGPDQPHPQQEDRDIRPERQTQGGSKIFIESYS